MRGELDFDGSLRKRVELLAGAPASIIDVVKQRLLYFNNRITFNPGAKELCRSLKIMGYTLAVVSGNIIGYF